MPASVDQAVDMLHLTSRSSELFLQQPAVEQRRLLQVVVEKAAWQDGTLHEAVLGSMLRIASVRPRGEGLREVCLGR